MLGLSISPTEPVIGYRIAGGEVIEVCRLATGSEGVEVRFDLAEANTFLRAHEGLGLNVFGSRVEVHVDHRYGGRFQVRLGGDLLWLRQSIRFGRPHIRSKSGKPVGNEDGLTVGQLAAQCLGNQFADRLRGSSRLLEMVWSLGAGQYRGEEIRLGPESLLSILLAFSSLPTPVEAPEAAKIFMSAVYNAFDAAHATEIYTSHELLSHCDDLDIDDEEQESENPNDPQVGEPRS